MKFWYHVCFVLARVALFFWHPVLRVSGLENLPLGAAVLCANHSSGADAMWVLLALRQPEMLRIMAKSELRRVPFVGWVMEKFHIIFVHRGEHDTQAVEQAIQVGAPIRYDDTAQSPHYNYWRDRAEHEVWFEDARSIRAKLALAGEYRLTGVSIWNIMRYFPQLWLVLNNLYDIEKL